ncbi:hypothetical protein LB523_12010 [Mesorhizobium sp. ESP-6-4]|uniref:hypothetical protein n=1 Tax=Mesorhizobium sp. ESP-6-4 TaxID=2876624 RepID=UPI001CCECD76|nr:hypothetical protein [Mesorhizobium sp. ESP-6-4]MBZ9659770.1 hypothetical protein [Mesorhizobium sp. ESP-6-4]
MTVELRTLAISAQLDASQYVSGAAQKVAADKSMSASSQIAGASVTETNTKISQAGDVLSRLSRQYVDGYANAQRFNSALNQLSSGIDRGKISMEQAGNILTGIYAKYQMMGDAAQFAARGQTQLAAAVTAANAKLAQQQQRAPANTNRLSGQQIQGLGFQANDIATMALLGASPQQIAFSQGGQILQTLQMGEGGVAGSLSAIKGSAVAAGAALAGTLGTVGLIATGFGAAAVAAGAFYLATREKAKDLNAILSEQKDIITSLGPAYQALAGQQSGPFENVGVGRLVLEQNLQDAQKAAMEKARSALSDMRSSGGTFLSLIGSLPEGAQSALGRSQSSLEFDRIVDAASKSEMSINEARSSLQRFGETHPDFAYIIGRFLQMSEEAAKAERQVGGLVGILDKFAKIRLPEKGILPKGAAGDEIDVATITAQYRMQRQFNADMLGANARSPQELAAAARAQAELNPSGSAAEQATRVELAGKKALAEAELQLTEAEDQRQRSLIETTKSMHLDVDLVGKSTAQVEAAKFANQQLAQVREEAARNGITSEADIQRYYGKSIDLIKQQATEYGKLKALEEARNTIFSQGQNLEIQRAELALVGQGTLAHDAAIAALKTEQQIRQLGIDVYGQEANAMRANTAELSALTQQMAKAKIQQDLLFDIRQAGRSAADQSVASQLRSAGFSDQDLDSDVAKLIRMKDTIESMKAAWEDVFQTARDGIDGVVDALFDGGSISDALKNAGKQLARTLFDQAITNPLKNWLTGSNLNTIADLGIFPGAVSGKGGGFGGVLGNLLGAQKAVASMQVQAASVFINGSPLGLGGLGNLLGGNGSTFTPNTTLTDLLTGGDVNASQANISQRINSAFGTLFSQDQIQSRISSAFGGAPLGGIFTPAGGFANVLGGGSSLTGNMSSFASAIKMIESAGSGGYSALGPLLKNGNQALGAYQIMKSNLPSWSTEALGSPMSASSFLSNPAAQDTIFNQQFGKLLSKFGNPQDAASAWFTGGPLSAGAGKMDILGTSGAQYVSKFNAALSQATQNVGQLGGASSSTLSNLISSTSQAAGGLNQLGSGAGKLGSMLSQFPAAPGGWGGGLGGLFNMFGGLFGGGGLNSAFSGTAAYSFLSANPGGYIGLYADGTESAPPGWAWVGEKGPELRKLRAGDVIRSNARSADMVKAAGGGAGNDNMKDFVRMLAPHLKSNVRINNIFDPSVVGDYLATPQGEEIIMNVLRRNGK